jgi:hypothetical protein
LLKPLVKDLKEFRLASGRPKATEPIFPDMDLDA